MLLNKKEKKGEKPIKEGQEIEVVISSKGKFKDGIVGYGNSNYIIIVNEAEVGKKYLIKISKVTKRVAFGKILLLRFAMMELKL